jgi:hypothetical protein
VLSLCTLNVSLLVVGSPTVILTERSDAALALGLSFDGPLQVGPGIVCTREGVYGPPSYAAAMIGHTGVPKASANDVRMLRAISKYTKVKTLRFVFLRNNFEHNRFIVFSASLSQLCNPSAPPFIALNGACNEYYIPTLNQTSAAGSCVNPRRPWIRGDRGSAKTTWPDQLREP